MARARPRPRGGPARPGRRRARGHPRGDALRPPRILGAIVTAAALTALGALAWALSRRFAYPYDLEWMEGGVLCHALRLQRGEPLYAPPSVDFIPFLYTPLYPALLALLGKVVPLGYALGRALSLIGFVATLGAVALTVRREGGPRAPVLWAVALPAAAFVPTGVWYDLARPDSLYLGLTASALALGFHARRADRRGDGAAALSAALLIAAFFTKQTASPFMVALGLALLALRPRAAILYGATLALLGLPLLYWQNMATGGWFWTYVFRLHQQHDFYPDRAFAGSPARLALLVGPALPLVPWALLTRRSPGLLYATWLGLTGAGASCLGFGTQWAFTNAFIPGVVFLALAAGVAAGRLLDGTGDGRGARPILVHLALLASLWTAGGGLLPRVAPLVPRAWGIERDAPTGYDLRPTAPTAEDRRRGDALVARLRAAPGEVLVPFHPFYAHLAGKRTFLHRMGVLDVGRAGLGVPAGLAEAIRSQRFALVVMDNKIEGNWQMWPGLLDRYEIVGRLDGPPVRSGATTEPRHLLRPRGQAGALVPGAAPGEGP